MINLEFSRSDYAYEALLPNSVAIVPYFNGVSEQKHSAACTSVVYLIKTVASLSKYCERIIVIVCNDPDVRTVKNLGLEFQYIKPEKPGWLPVEGLNYFRDKKLADYIFYSEGDSLWHVEDMQILQNQMDRGRAIVPYRLNRICEGKNKNLVISGQTFEMDGMHYVVRNWKEHKFGGKGIIFTSRIRPVMFAGAWVMPWHLYKNIDFIKREDSMVERACWSVIDEGFCYKFKKIQRFFIEHLSTFDRGIKEKMNLMPHLW